MISNIPQALESWISTSGKTGQETKQKLDATYADHLAWLDFEDKWIVAPSSTDFADIDDYISEVESNSEDRALLARARQRLSAHIETDGPTIASLRLKAGLSQKEVAKTIGNSQPSYSNIESGKTDIQLSTARRIAEAFGVSLDELDEAMKNSIGKNNV